VTDSSDGRFRALRGIERWLDLARHEVAIDCSSRATSAMLDCISRALWRAK